ncbi:histidine kinase dimerization/phospho-acceptor domain-containing protein [Streptomyces caniscabiei]|uniref:histidine kinase dimerization/phospho-acceptor domain-containing protein n=1 Tax=Streptomyces caniscabiei TaxID=2746961 RepID=UPI003AF3257B
MRRRLLLPRLHRQMRQPLLSPAAARPQLRAQQVETAHHARERSAAQLRRFVGDASHELRTPLAAIRGYPQLHDKGHAHRLRRAPACLGPDAQRGRPDGPPRRRAAHPRPPRPAPRTAPPERGPLPPGP